MRSSKSTVEMERAVIRRAAAEVESLVFRGLANWAVATICDCRTRIGVEVGLVTWMVKQEDDRSCGVELRSSTRSCAMDGGGRRSGREPGSAASGEPSVGSPKTSPTSMAVANVGMLERPWVRA